MVQCLFLTRGDVFLHIQELQAPNIEPGPRDGMKFFGHGLSCPVRCLAASSCDAYGPAGDMTGALVYSRTHLHLYLHLHHVAHACRPDLWGMHRLLVQGGTSSNVCRGVITRAHMVGNRYIALDRISGKGDPGGGIFSAATGRLLGVLVGRDTDLDKSYMIQANVLLAATVEVS